MAIFNGAITWYLRNYCNCEKPRLTLAFAYTNNGSLSFICGILFFLIIFNYQTELISTLIYIDCLQHTHIECNAKCSKNNTSSSSPSLCLSVPLPLHNSIIAGMIPESVDKMRISTLRRLISGNSPSLTLC